MLKNLFKKSFNIRDGEIGIALLMQCYIFIIITVLLLVKPTVTALFLSNLGSEHLPYGYLLVAFIAVLTSIFYNRLMQLFSIKIIAIATVILFSAFFFVLSYVVYVHYLAPWILYFYYLSISLFAVMVTSQFWVVANIVFDVREAKRIFGFIGAGAIAGGIFGGYLTTLLANYFGNGMVILVAALLLLVCLPIIFWVWKIRVDHMDKFTKQNRKKSKKSVSKNSLSIVFQSKHLLYLSAIVGVSVIVAKLVDYQFSDFSNKAFTDPNELASFFGFWFSSFNVVAFLIQLFLTNKLLAWFGVNTNLLILPLSIAFGSILFLIFPELWVLILIKGVDGSFKQSINKAAFELSILPVPFEIKKQAKPFIDVVVDSIATGIAGFLLLFVIKGLEVSSTYITVITIFFLFVWLLLIYQLREAYFDSFRQNIKEAIVSSKNKKTKRKNSKASNIEVFSTGSEKEILSLLNLLDKQMIRVYKPYVIQLLDHESDKVKASAIREVSHFKNEKLLSKIKEIIEKTNDDEVVYEAMEYFLMHSARSHDKVFRNYLDHPKDYISNAALLCLVKSARYDKTLSKKYNLNQRIEKQIKEFVDEEDLQREEEIAELLITIGYSGKSEFYDFIEKYLHSKNPFLVDFAIKATGLTKYEPFIPVLIKLMDNKKYRKSIVQAMKAYGETITDSLLSIHQEERIEGVFLRYIPEIIESFETKNSLIILTKLLRSYDVKVRLQASKYLAILEEKNPLFKITNKKLSAYIFKENIFLRETLTATEVLKSSLKKNAKSKDKLKIKEQAARESLIDYLENMIEKSLETIFNLLSLRYAESDMEVVFLGIKNKEENSRINAIEFLDNLLQADLKKDLLPLLEYFYLKDEEANFAIEPVSENQLLVNLLSGHSITTRIHVLKLMSYIKDKSFDKPLQRLQRHKHKKVSSLAKKIINSEK